MNQIERVLKTLKRVGFITSVKAKSYGITNLRARIYDLRCQGYNIKTTMYVRKDGREAAKYELKI